MKRKILYGALLLSPFVFLAATPIYKQGWGGYQAPASPGIYGQALLTDGNYGTFWSTITSTSTSGPYEFNGNVGINTPADPSYDLKTNGAVNVGGEFVADGGVAYVNAYGLFLSNNSVFGAHNASLITFQNSYGHVQGFTFKDPNAFIFGTFDTLNDIVNIGTTTVIPSAELSVNSIDKGFLPPAMTTSQKTAIPSPAEGLVVYDLTLHKLCVYTGSSWETVTSL